VTPHLIYVLDANVFIEAAKRYYAFDIVPDFWDKLIALAEDGWIMSIDRVKAELIRADLEAWANGNFHRYFASTSDQDVIDAYRDLMAWSQAQSQYTDGAKAEFASVPDGWLIAYALSKGCTVVTHEQPAPNSKRKIKMPDACRAHNVQYVNTFQMLRNLSIKLC
jgi:predicted nucleic acid-binding protein